MDHLPQGSVLFQTLIIEYILSWRWQLRQFQHKQGLVTALVVALVLVLQSSLAVWASASTSGAPMLDGWGNPLCITSMSQDGDDPATDPPGMLDCCTLGCCISSAAFATPSDDSVTLLPLLIAADALRDIRKAGCIQILDHDPGIPRAPPLMTWPDHRRRPVR